MFSFFGLAVTDHEESTKKIIINTLNLVKGLEDLYQVKEIMSDFNLLQ